MAYASKDYITYSPMMASQQSNGGIPCIQRFASGRWKVISLVVIIIVQAVILYTGYMCHSKSNTSTPMQISRERSAAPKTVASVTTSATGSDEGESTEAPYKHSKQRFPHFLIIGVKKAGTRALISYLRMHPDIKTASAEIHFFDRDESYEKGLEWYRKQMPYSYSEQLTGEKSPSYFREETVPERIQQFNASIKLILVVREPIERTMSNYLQHADGQDDYTSFESSVLLSNGEVNPSSPHVKNSDYDAYIDPWLKLFPPEQLNVVDGNLLIKSPHLVLKELQEFLGVRPYIDETFFKFDEEKGFYCFYNRSESLKCLGESKGRKHPPIKADLKLKLYKYFEPKNKSFFKKIGKTFNWELKQ